MNKLYLFLLLFLFMTTYSCQKVKNHNQFPLKGDIVQNNIKIKKNSPIIIYGDTRNNYEIHKKVVKSFLKKSPAMVFNTGDLVYDGDNTSLWPLFYNIIKPILKVARYYPVLGNHERNSINYFKLFNLPNNEKWYSIDFKNINFFILDSNSDLSVDSRQHLWLNSKLKASKKHFKILIFHHPLYSVGRHGGEIKLRNSLMELIKKYKVQLIFNGHDHSYQRFTKDKTTFIVTGGGGAPLYDKVSNSDDEKFLKKFIKTYHYCLLKPKNNQLLLEIYDISNKLIDEILIK